MLKFHICEIHITFPSRREGSVNIFSVAQVSFRVLFNQIDIVLDTELHAGASLMNVPIGSSLFKAITPFFFFLSFSTHTPSGADR